MELVKLLINVALTLVALPLTLSILIVRKALAQAIFIERNM